MTCAECITWPHHPNYQPCHCVVTGVVTADPDILHLAYPTIHLKVRGSRSDNNKWLQTLEAVLAGQAVPGYAKLTWQ